jgi:hypothetical protein
VEARQRVSEHHATYLDDRHLYVWDDEAVEVVVERFKEDRDGILRAEVSISSRTVGHILGPARLNLLSDRSIKGMANTANDRTDIPDWYAILTVAANDSVKFWRDGEQLEQVTLGAAPHRSWVLDPWLEDSGYSVIFARGGSGKSYLAAAISLSIASGHPIFGNEPAVVGPVAYLDWEATKPTFDMRVSRLARAFNITTPEVWYRHEKATLYSVAPQLSRAFGQHGVVAAVIDSKGMAISGGPEDAQSTLELSRGIRRLGVPVILVDHVSKGAIKGDDPDMAFGSVYTEYGSRLAWKVDSEARPGEIVMTIKNTKANNGPRRPNQQVTLMFTDDTVEVLSNGSSAPVKVDERLPDAF